MPLVERALQALERREVRPQLGLLKSTMLQLDPTFNEKAYGAGSFTDFVEKLQKANFVQVIGGEGRYMIKRVGAPAHEKAAPRPEQALPVLRDVLETHRLELDNGSSAEELGELVKSTHPDFDWKNYGFQEFGELLNYAQDKLLVRVDPTEDRGLMVYLGGEFYPPAVPEPAPELEPAPEEEMQPMVAGQPVARGEAPKAPTKRKGTSRKKSASSGGNESPAPRKRAPRPRVKQIMQ
jgi:hypothetical protein